MTTAFNSLSAEHQMSVIATNPRPEFADAAMAIYSSASSFRGAESLGSLVIMPMIPFFSATDVTKLLATVKSNRQIWDAAGTPKLLEQLFDNTNRYIPVNQDAWKSLVDFLSKEYSWLAIHGKGWEDTGWGGLLSRLEQVGLSIPILQEP